MLLIHVEVRPVRKQFLCQLSLLNRALSFYFFSFHYLSFDCCALFSFTNFAMYFPNLLLIDSIYFCQLCHLHANSLLIIFIYSLINTYFLYITVFSECTIDLLKHEKKEYSAGGIISHVIESLSLCDESIKKELMQNVLLSGGTSLLPGIISGF